MSHLSSHGYVITSIGNKRHYEHRLIAARALGRPLETNEEIHHFSGKDNSQGLVICESAAYHRLLHKRQRVVEAGGNPDTDKICSACKIPKPKTNFSATKRNSDGLNCYCHDCVVVKVRLKWRAANPIHIETVACEVCGGPIIQRVSLRFRVNIHRGRCYHQKYYQNNPDKWQRTRSI